MGMTAAFDREAALRYAGQEDRDAALFFAGRDAERAAFRAGLALAHSPAEDGGDPRVVLRVFQGAPGCGKTSFVRRMRAENDDVLFVQVEKAHLRSLALLRERICDAALKADKGRNIVASLASAGMELLRLGDAGRKAASFAADSAAENTRLVIWKDEAQVLDAPCDALVESHQGGDRWTSRRGHVRGMATAPQGSADGTCRAARGRGRRPLPD